MATLKVLGISDEVTDCSCCGRAGLKRTVTLGILDADGAVIDQTHYGTACAAAALKWSELQVRREVKNVVDATRKADEAAKEATRQAEGARWRAWLLSQTGIADAFLACQKLGGFGLARKLFNASEVA